MKIDYFFAKYNKMEAYLIIAYKDDVYPQQRDIHHILSHYYKSAVDETHSTLFGNVILDVRGKLRTSIPRLMLWLQTHYTKRQTLRISIITLKIEYCRYQMAADITTNAKIPYWEATKHIRCYKHM